MTEQEKQKWFAKGYYAGIKWGNEWELDAYDGITQEDFEEISKALQGRKKGK